MDAANDRRVHARRFGRRLLALTPSYCPWYLVRHRTKRHIVPRRTPPGAAPGSVVVDPRFPKPTIRVISYGPEAIVEKENVEIAKLSSYLGKNAVVWIDVAGLGDEAALKKIAETFSLHPLALEDVAHVDQRAKVEEYGEHLLFVVARLVTKDERFHTEQISLFVGDGFVLSFQERSGDSFQQVRERLRGGRGRMRSMGPDYLAYALIDSVIDSYFPLMEQFGERLDKLDDDLDENTAKYAMPKIHDARSELLLLRRAIWPHREAINQLVRDPHHLIKDETRVFLRDCYDNVMQLIDLTETYRELCSDLRDECLSFISNRLNEVMKVLTIIATIFMPISFLASLYGMNFDTSVSPLNMPELRWRLGYPFALFLMLSSVLGMLYFFRSKGWIGPASRPNSREDQPRSF